MQTHRRYLADTRDPDGGGFLAEFDPERPCVSFSDGLNPPSIFLTDSDGTEIEVIGWADIRKLRDAADKALSMRAQAQAEAA